jgi:hypothetical protein
VQARSGLLRGATMASSRLRDEPNLMEADPVHGLGLCREPAAASALHLRLPHTQPDAKSFDSDAFGELRSLPYYCFTAGECSRW